MEVVVMGGGVERKFRMILLSVCCILLLLLMMMMKKLGGGSCYCLIINEEHEHDEMMRDDDQMSSEFDKWVGWHVNNFKNTTTTTNIISSRSSSSSSSGPGPGPEIDLKLRNAERKKRSISVGQDGSGDFTSITAAIQSIPNSNTRRVLVFIQPGLYREKIVISSKKPFVTLMGNASDPPTITWNDTAQTAGSTLLSATVAINSHYFVAINIHFQNTAHHGVGSNRSQAVALQISGTKGAFYKCNFSGIQDTLYDHKGLHCFKNCLIQGDVDFICGYGQSLYENCRLYSIGSNGASITAQKRSEASMASGFSFKNCVVIRAAAAPPRSRGRGRERGGNNNNNNNNNGMVYLGRAWGNYSRVVFSYTYMDNIVLPQRWNPWGKPNQTIYYGEYKCSGPGSNTNGRVPWARVLTDQEAQPFLGPYFIQGDTWIISP